MTFITFGMCGTILSGQMQPDKGLWKKYCKYDKAFFRNV